MTETKKSKGAGKLKLVNYIIENDQQPVVIIRDDHVEHKVNLDKSLKVLSKAASFLSSLNYILKVSLTSFCL